MNFYGLTVILFVASICAIANCQRQAQCCEEYCYDLDSDRSQSLHFGTKTAYQIIKGTDNSRHYYVPNCKPTKLWMLARHGTRLPKAKNLGRFEALENLRDEVINNYFKRHSKPDVGALCEGDLELLKRWRWDRNVTADYSEFLTVQGWNDMKFMAIHYQRIFPDILENVYDQQKYLFKYTSTQRTEASFKAFVEGLFGESADRYVRADGLANDTLLRPYNDCKEWNEQKTKKEQKKFEKNQIFTQVISDVSARLGFKYALKIDQIHDIYDMCRYDLAWNLDRPSAWCVAFTPNQINILEYWEDINAYYETGYGSSLNPKIQCEAVKDMMRHLQSNDLPKAVAYFAHSATVQLFLTSLGAAKDFDALNADNYASMTRRKFRTSQLAPFASNLVAIKYECAQEVERNKIMFFLNEKPLDFGWCKVGLCDWSDVQEKYKTFVNADCRSSYCTNSGHSTTKFNWNQFLFSALFFPLIKFLRF